ncbi:MAG TPA: rhamnulokinase family protein [Rugosimonospora sp.]|nr:rhamnulokinase family protein [Rugosimonospora sp.]
MTGREATVAAVDLGASSGRVIAARITPDGLSAREVHRFPNTPVRVRGLLHWDALALFRGVLDGLRAARAAVGALDAVGIDGWAVDYGLLDAEGRLLGNPVHYRDPRTGPALAAALETVGAQGLWDATGVAAQPFNTVFQMLAEPPAALDRARRLLLVPDLVAYWLGAEPGTELTNASTTGLLDARTRQWSADLAGRLDVRLDLFPPLRSPGTLAGTVSAEAATEAGLDGRPSLVTVPSHDTAAAVAGIPAAGPDVAFVSSGTWALVGLTIPEPIVTEASRVAGFTNEVGSRGQIRFLRNVTGFWLLQECVRHWQRAGLPADVAELTTAAAAVPALRSLVDVQHPDFLAPADMPAAILAHARRTGGPTPGTPAEVTRCVLDSVALAVRQALRDATRLAGRDAAVVHLIGGGVANPLFCQLVADACGRPVLAGPTEAASLGNVLHQAEALGVVADVPERRAALLATAQPPVRYEPRGDEGAWAAADERVLATRR